MLYFNTTARIINEPHVASDFHPATTAAFRLGAYAARLDELCVPESLFLFRKDKEEFCRGYASVKGATMTTVQFLGSH